MEFSTLEAAESLKEYDGERREVNRRFFSATLQMKITP